jgi:segregation and condensation protein B
MDLKLILESILFSAQKPLSTRELRDLFSSAAELAPNHEAAKALKKVKDEELCEHLDLLQKDYDTLQRSYRLTCVAGSWQFVSHPDFAPWIVALVGQKPRPPKLSQPSLETLAIIAYRQPITRAEIEQIRGVAVDGVMQTLVERGLVEQVGRAEVVGRPITYGTTALFLEYFGLNQLEDLPAGDELRRIPVQKPEALLTTPDELVAQETSTSITEPVSPTPENIPAAETNPIEEAVPSTESIEPEPQKESPDSAS